MPDNRAPASSAPLRETLLADYRPPAFLVDSVDPDLDLEESATRMRSRLVMRRNPDASPDAPLRLDGVGSNIYYPRPLHRQPTYERHHDGSALPVSDTLAARILALPMHANLEVSDIDRIAAVVRTAL